eukprot:9799359-Lingulodinium_polyedra.AAC.1
MSSIILQEDQQQHVQDGEVATLRVYVTDAAKRAVVIKDGDILTKQELQEHAEEVSGATLTEIKIWLLNNCFVKCDINKAKNVMTSRYVAKWKW